jgi:prepilin-type N-terminal cleavage/methylation domain-containing protein
MTDRTVRLLRRSPRSRRLGFNLIELLIALGISAALLASTMVALNACFIAYQTTTEEASTHTISRLIMHRILAMVRTGTEFGPMPDDPLVELVESDSVEFTNSKGEVITITFDPQGGRLLYQVNADSPVLLLAGVQRTVIESDGDTIEMPAFMLEYEKGTHLRRFSMDLTVMPDDNQSTKFDLGVMRPIRLVASSMPRAETW